MNPDTIAKGLAGGYLAFHGAQEKERTRQDTAARYTEDVAVRRETLGETRRQHDLQYQAFDVAPAVNMALEAMGNPRRVKGPMSVPRNVADSFITNTLKGLAEQETPITYGQLGELGNFFETGEAPMETIPTAQVEDVPGLGEREPPVVTRGEREVISPGFAALLKRPAKKEVIGSLTSARTAGAAAERARESAKAAESRRRAGEEERENRRTSETDRRDRIAGANLALRERYQQYLEADMDPGQALAKARSDVSANFPDVTPTWGPMPVSPTLEAERKERLKALKRRNEVAANMADLQSQMDAGTLSGDSAMKNSQRVSAEAKRDLELVDLLKDPEAKQFYRQAGDEAGRFAVKLRQYAAGKAKGQDQTGMRIARDRVVEELFGAGATWQALTPAQKQQVADKLGSLTGK